MRIHWKLRLIALVVAAGLVSCSDGSETRPRGTPYRIASADLPFGLGTIDGVTPLGRPAVVRGGQSRPTAGVEADQVELTAAFRVEDGDAVAAFRRLIDKLAQTDDLQLGQIEVLQDSEEAGDSWLTANGLGFLDVCCDGDASDNDSFHLELWTTQDDPVMVLHVTQHPGRGAATIPAEPFTVEKPPASSLKWLERKAGDLLFEEYGESAVRLPPGARSLMPTLPSPCGAGGSFSVFFAEDGREAVQAMIHKAEAAGRSVETVGPQEQGDGGSVVSTTVIYLERPWIEIVSARGPSDPVTTLYVTSCVSEE